MIIRVKNCGHLVDINPIKLTHCGHLVDIYLRIINYHKTSQNYKNYFISESYKIVKNH